MRTPNGIRTRATAVKGRRPRPLDDEGVTVRYYVLVYFTFLNPYTVPEPIAGSVESLLSIRDATVISRTGFGLGRVSAIIGE